MCMQCDIESGGKPLDETYLAELGVAIAQLGHEIGAAATSEEDSWVTKLERVHDALAEAVATTLSAGPSVFIALHAERTRIAGMN